jgi:hypothetical protein
MPLSVKANLLDDGVVDTLGPVGAMCGFHTDVSVNAADQNSPEALVRSSEIMWGVT